MFSLFIFFPCYLICHSVISFFFFFNDTATTEIYTLSLHDALPIFSRRLNACGRKANPSSTFPTGWKRDRKSTRLNSSHQIISYAVFCLKKKKKHNSKRCHVSH